MTEEGVESKRLKTGEDFESGHRKKVREWDLLVRKNF